MLMSTREPSYYVERLQQIMVQIENMQQIVESILGLSGFQSSQAQNGWNRWIYLWQLMKL